MTTNADDLDQPVDEALLRGDADEQDDTEVVQEEVAAEVDADPAEAEPEAERREETIPKARFNEVNEERKALRAELERLQNEQAQREQKAEDQVDIKALRREATVALLEGEHDKYEELQDQIHAETMRLAEAAAEARMAQRAEATAFKTRAAELTAAYPALNPETGDPEAISLVIDLRDAYINKGMNMVDALEKAVMKIAPRFETAPEVVPDTRTAEAIQRGAKDSNRIPPQGGGVGNRALPPASTAEPTQSEWDSMTPTQREKALAAAA